MVNSKDLLWLINMIIVIPLYKFRYIPDMLQYIMLYHYTYSHDLIPSYPLTPHKTSPHWPSRYGPLHEDSPGAMHEEKDVAIAEEIHGALQGAMRQKQQASEEAKRLSQWQ